ncbi:MAG: hypothetical protein R2737_09975 [Candidatus Nanopelagicales bacterium]
MSAVETVDTPAPVERRYGFSVLLSGFARMVRAWRPVLVAVVLNTVVQALLTWPDLTPGLSLWFLLASAVSFAAFLLALALQVSAALHAVDGPVSLGAAMATARERLGWFSLHAVLLLVAVMIGLMLYTVPGLVVIALTPFVLLAAMDGRRNVVATNFHAMGFRFGRWLLTTVVLAVVLFVFFLLAALNSFFIGGVIASVIAWLVLGLLSAWLLCAWATVYRSTPAGAQEQVSSAA